MARRKTLNGVNSTHLPRIERSFEGLRDALFDEFDLLRSNKTKPERSNAASRLASEITKSVSVQVDLLRFSSNAGLIGDKVDAAKRLLK